MYTIFVDKYIHVDMPRLTSDAAVVPMAHLRFDRIARGDTHIYTDGLCTKGTRALTHRELIRDWLWEPKGSSLEYIYIHSYIYSIYLYIYLCIGRTLHAFLLVCQRRVVWFPWHTCASTGCESCSLYIVRYIYIMSIDLSKIGQHGSSDNRRFGDTLGGGANGTPPLRQDARGKKTYIHTHTHIYNIHVCVYSRELPLGSQSHSRISSLCVCARVPFVL